MATVPSEKERRLVVRIEDGTSGEPAPTDLRKGAGKGNRKGQIRGKNGQQIMRYSFRSVAALGVGLRLGKQANDLVGAYTGRKYRSNQIKSGVQIATLAYGALKFGPTGIAYAAGNLLYEGALQRINAINENTKSQVYQIRSGLATTQGNRQGGRKI